MTESLKNFLFDITLFYVLPLQRVGAASCRSLKSGPGEPVSKAKTPAGYEVKLGCNKYSVVTAIEGRRSHASAISVKHP
jgi:hypothetical protein